MLHLTLRHPVEGCRRVLGSSGAVIRRLLRSLRSRVEFYNMAHI